MEEFFLISKKNIDYEGDISDLNDTYYAEEYCMEVLDIPEEHLYEVKLTQLGLEISLDELINDSFVEDWYTQLRSISNRTLRQYA